MGVGDIYLVDLPRRKGHEQRGLRPVIIVVIHSDVSMSTIVPLTTSHKAKAYQNTIEILPDN